jgi:hypothetical protein
MLLPLDPPLLGSACDERLRPGGGRSFLFRERVLLNMDMSIKDNKLDKQEHLCEMTGCHW